MILTLKLISLCFAPILLVYVHGPKGFRYFYYFITHPISHHLIHERLRSMSTCLLYMLACLTSSTSYFSLFIDLRLCRILRPYFQVLVCKFDSFVFNLVSSAFYFDFHSIVCCQNGIYWINAFP